MELVDILVLGTSALVRVGSNPTEGRESSTPFCFVIAKAIEMVEDIFHFIVCSKAKKKEKKIFVIFREQSTLKIFFPK